MDTAATGTTAASAAIDCGCDICGAAIPVGDVDAAAAVADMRDEAELGVGVSDGPPWMDVGVAAAG